MPEKQIITAEKAPQPIGPYSAGVRAGPFIYTAGQIGIDPATGDLVSGGIEAETRQVLTNVKNILEAAGVSMGRVIKTTVFLGDMLDFTRMNVIYTEFFSSDPPARTTVAVSGLPKGASVEIEAIALME
jgi:2-iminobutanoate/2-iminopropanoate deaminase